MPRSSEPARSSALAATATTLAALLAVVTTASMAHGGAVPGERRASISEVAKVRAVAAAMAAVARDLIGQEHTGSAAVCWRDASPGAGAPIGPIVVREPAAAPAGTCGLDERLLDLPPPIR